VPQRPIAERSAKLSATHDLSQFASGEPALDDWLRRRALQNEETGASRTYVVCAGSRWSATMPWRLAPWRLRRLRAVSAVTCPTLFRSWS